jgi:hypothetical protein
VGIGAVTVGPTGYTIPANSYFRIRVRGSVILSSNPLFLATFPNTACCSENGSYGPGGTAYVNELRVGALIHYTDNSGSSGINFPGLGYGPSAPDSAVSAVAFTTKEAEVWIGRNGVNGSANNNVGSGNVGMYSMSGSQTATIEILTDFVHLTPSPAVKAGQTVHFQMATDDGTPATVWQWSWTKDPGSNANPISGCANAWDFCNGTVWGPGTLSGRTDYGWASAHVTVYSSFALDADHLSVMYGDTVTFTPKYDGVAGPAARWQWLPSDTSSDHSACASGVTTCKKEMHGSGKMWAFTSTGAGGDSDHKDIVVTIPTLTLGAFQQSGAPGRTVTFRPAWSDGRAITSASWSWLPDTLPGQTTACGGTPPLCQAVVRESGTMTVQVTRGGTVFSAQRHVIVVPCPTGDTLLDIDEVRQGLAFLFDANHGAAPQNRREQPGYVYLDTLTGEYHFLADNNPANGVSPCKSTISNLPAPPNSFLILIMHPHPVDPLTDKLPPHGPCNPSDSVKTGFWGTSQLDDSVALQGYPVFAVDRDSIYRTDGPTQKQSWSRSSACKILPPMVMNKLRPHPRVEPDKRSNVSIPRRLP